MVEELKVKLTADVESFKKGMKQAQDALEETTDKGEEAESSFERMAQTMESISPTFKAAADKWRQSSEKLGSTFSKNGKLAKGFKLAGLVAIGGVVAAVLKEVVGAIVEAAKKVWQFAKDTAKMYDPQGFSKSTGAMEKSIKKLKTAVGSFTAPVVNALQNAFSKIIDGITWVVEKVRIGLAYITGIVKAVFEPVVNGIKQVVSWVQGAINVLGNFLGIGDIFKQASDSAEDAAGSIEEVTDATSAGLASFDKLTTLNFEGMGDAEEAEKISDAIGKAEKDGKDLIEGLNDWLEKLNLRKVWDDFVKGCTDIKEKIVSGVTGWFDDAGKWASDMWDKFVTGCTNLKNDIVEGVTSWFGNAATWASDMWDKFSTACVNIKNNIVEGVTSWFDNASIWATGMWDKFTTACGDLKTSIVEKVTDWFSGASEWASDMWDSFVTACTDLKDSIVEAIVKWFTDASTWASDMWDSFVKGCGDVKTWIVEKITDWFSGASDWASGVWDDFVDGCVDVKNRIVEKVTDWFSGAGEWASGVWEKFVNSVSDFKTKLEEKFSELVSGIPGIFTSLWEGIKETFNKYVLGPIVDGINTIIRAYNSIPLLPDIGEIDLGGGSGGSSGGGSGGGGGSSGDSGPGRDTGTFESTILDDFYGGIKDAWNGFTGWISDGVDSIKSGLADIGQSAADVLNGAAETIGKPLVEAWEVTVLGTAKAGYEQLSDGIIKSPDVGTGFISDVVSDYIEDPAQAWENTKESFSKGAEAIKDGAEFAADVITDYIEDPAQAWENTKKSASNMWNGFKSFIGLAGGGAIAPGNPQPYILGDNNREYEVVSPVSLMEQTVISAMKKMGIVGSSQSDRPIEVSIELDGRKMARALYDPMETEKRRRGVRA